MVTPRYTSLGVSTNIILAVLLETLNISSMRAETLSPKDCLFDKLHNSLLNKQHTIRIYFHFILWERGDLASVKN